MCVHRLWTQTHHPTTTPTEIYVYVHHRVHTHTHNTCTYTPTSTTLVPVRNCVNLCMYIHMRPKFPKAWHHPRHPRVPLNRFTQVPESTTQSGYMCTREYHSIGLHTVMSCGNTAPYRAPESTTQSDTRPPESTTRSGHTCTREYHSIGLHMAMSHPAD